MFVTWYDSQNPHFKRNIVLTIVVGILVTVGICVIGGTILRPILIGPAGLQGPAGEVGAATAEPTRDPINILFVNQIKQATSQAQQVADQARQGEVMAAMATQLAQLMATPVPTATQPAATAMFAAQPTAQPTSVAAPAAAVDTTQSNGWTINRIDVAKDPIVNGWLLRLRTIAPELWPTYPNVPNPKVPEFRVVNGNQVPDGVEYGKDDSPFCEYKQTCDWVVPAWHYRLITGDYKFTSPQFSYECKNVEGQPRKGCLIVLFNVMDQTYTWRNQSVDNGFTVMGRYWNGDALEWAAWGLVSHASANMLNMPTMRDPTTGNVLNAGGLSSNAGANCGIQPDACSSVDVTIIVHAGDRILATAQTTVSR